MLHAFNAEYDLALTYALRRPKLARACARQALANAREMRRPDLMASANDLLASIGGAS